MNNQSFEKNYVDMPIESFNNSNTCSATEPKIKQEIMTIPNIIPGSSRQVLSSTMGSQLELSRTNDTIEYISNNDLDDDNIQGNYFTLTITMYSIILMNLFLKYFHNNSSSERLYNNTYARNQYNFAHNHNAG